MRCTQVAVLLCDRHRAEEPKCCFSIPDCDAEMRGAPCLASTLASKLAHLQDTLAKDLQEKEQMRTVLKQQLETQSKTFSSVEKDAQTLLMKALHAGRKVTVSLLMICLPPANLSACAFNRLCRVRQHASQASAAFMQTAHSHLHQCDCLGSIPSVAFECHDALRCSVWPVTQ